MNKSCFIYAWFSVSTNAFNERRMYVHFYSIVVRLLHSVATIKFMSSNKDNNNNEKRQFHLLLCIWPVTSNSIIIQFFPFIVIRMIWFDMCNRFKIDSIENSHMLLGFGLSTLSPCLRNTHFRLDLVSWNWSSVRRAHTKLNEIQLIFPFTSNNPQAMLKEKPMHVIQ